MKQDIVELLGYGPANKLVNSLPKGTELIAYFKVCIDDINLSRPNFYKSQRGCNLFHFARILPTQKKWLQSLFKDQLDLEKMAVVYTVDELKDSLEKYPSLKVEYGFKLLPPIAMAAIDTLPNDINKNSNAQMKQNTNETLSKISNTQGCVAGDAKSEPLASASHKLFEKTLNPNIGTGLTGVGYNGCEVLPGEWYVAESIKGHSMNQFFCLVLHFESMQVAGDKRFVRFVQPGIDEYPGTLPTNMLRKPTAQELKVFKRIDDGHKFAVGDWIKLQDGDVVLIDLINPDGGLSVESCEIELSPRTAGKAVLATEAEVLQQMQANMANRAKLINAPAFKPGDYIIHKNDGTGGARLVIVESRPSTQAGRDELTHKYKFNNFVTYTNSQFTANLFKDYRKATEGQVAEQRKKYFDKVFPVGTPVVTVHPKASAALYHVGSGSYVDSGFSTRIELLYEGQHFSYASPDQIRAASKPEVGLNTKLEDGLAFYFHPEHGYSFKPWGFAVGDAVEVINPDLIANYYLAESPVFHIHSFPEHGKALLMQADSGFITTLNNLKKPAPVTAQVNGHTVTFPNLVELSPQKRVGWTGCLGKKTTSTDYELMDQKHCSPACHYFNEPHLHAFPLPEPEIARLVESLKNDLSDGRFNGIDMRWTPVDSKPTPPQAPADKRKHSHYFKDVSHLQYIDVYRVCDLFKVTDSCIQHVIKKLLCTGQRGAKDKAHDIQDVIDTLVRHQEMQRENSEADHE